MITIAVHTYDFALKLKSSLESHGIAVKLTDFKVNNSALNPAVGVDIKEEDLPLALKIIESGAVGPALEARKLTGMSNNLLIPVDFSDMSLLAVHAGFELAARLSLHPILLHSFATPYFSGAFAGAPLAEPDDSLAIDAELEDVEVDKDMRHEANILMRKFEEDVKVRQKSGQLPEVEFSTLILEGVPEEVILNFTRQTPPALVVMATRGRNKREADLVGSVTAEVIDSCRVPLFTVPENYSFESIRDIVRLAVFCNLDQQDILSVDTLMRMFSYPAVDIWLIPVNDRAGAGLKSKLESLNNYFADNYPAASFHAAPLGAKTFRADFEELVSRMRLQMIIVPNKKKNILSRLFNPGIAHKLLFERDMPMLALPV